MRSLNLARGPARLNLLRAIRFAPYVFLWIDSVSYLLYELDIYEKTYLYLLSISGHSILWVVYTSLMLYLLRTCLYTWICMISLLMFNILSLFPISAVYYSIFMLIIIFTGISLSTVLIIKKCIKCQYVTL